MLRMESKSVNYGASCTQSEDQIAYFSATRNDTHIDVSISIDNINLYKTNLNTFESDFQNFMANVSSTDD